MTPRDQTSLPDETNLLNRGHPPRSLNPSDDRALPLYVQMPRARLRKRGERLVVESDGDTAEVPLIDVSQMALFGPVGVATSGPCPRSCGAMRREFHLRR